MVTVSQFKAKFLSYFRLLSETEGYIDMAYKGRVYRFHVEDMGVIAPPLKRRRKKPVIAIEKSKCSVCNGLVLNRICLSDSSHKP